jgi:hypothetical protein
VVVAFRAVVPFEGLSVAPAVTVASPQRHLLSWGLPALAEYV